MGTHVFGFTEKATNQPRWPASARIFDHLFVKIHTLVHRFHARVFNLHDS